MVKRKARNGRQPIRAIVGAFMLSRVWGENLGVKSLVDEQVGKGLTPGSTTSYLVLQSSHKVHRYSWVKRSQHLK